MNIKTKKEIEYRANDHAIVFVDVTVDDVFCGRITVVSGHHNDMIDLFEGRVRCDELLEKMIKRRK